MSLLIRNGTIVTQNPAREILAANIYVEDGRIIELTSETPDADRVIDAKDTLVMPGLINAHNHVGMSLLRGYTDDLSLAQFLERTRDLKDRKNRAFVRAGAFMGCLEMLLSGTTTFLDIYFFEDEVARVVDEVGIRALLAWGIVDPERTKFQDNPFDGAKAFVAAHREHPRIIPFLAPHSPYMCSQETLAKVKEFSLEADLSIQIHVAETRKEVTDFETEFGQRPVEYLDAIGFLGPNLSIAHSVWVSLDEVRQLGQSGTKVVHCPISNMKLASGGVAPLPEMFENDVTVGLGTDSCATNNNFDMFSVMKACALLQKFHRWDPTILYAQQALDLATIDGARAIGIDHLVGSIEPGKRADLVLIDVNAPAFVPLSNALIPSHLVYACTPQNVRDVIVDGQLVVKDRTITTTDLTEAIAFAQGVAQELGIHEPPPITDKTNGEPS